MKSTLRRSALGFGLLLVCGVLTGTANAAPAEGAGNAGGGIKWLRTLEEVNTAAQASGKPILAYFYSAECPECDWFQEQSLSDAGVALLAQQFVTCAFDGQNSGTLIRAYKVQRYPTVVIASSNGGLIESIPGAFDAPTFSERLGKVMARQTMNAMLQAAEDKPTDARAHARLAVAYAAANDLEGAETYFAKTRKLDPNNAQGTSLPMARALAMCYIGNREYEKAIEPLQYEISKAHTAREFAQTHFKLASSYVALNNLEAAKPSLEIILRAGEDEVTDEQKKWALTLTLGPRR